MARRTRLLARIRTPVGLALVAASVAACSLIAGLTEDYRVAPDGGPGITSEGGGDGPVDPDGGNVDGSVPTDGAADGPIDGSTDADFCKGALADGGPYAYCWDFEQVEISPRWGWDDEEHRYGSVTVQAGIGYNGSKGLHTTIVNPGLDGGGKTYLRKAIGNKPFTDFHKHELSFRFSITRRSTKIYGAALGTLGFSDASLLSYTGVGVYSKDDINNSLDVTDPPGTPGGASVPAGTTTTWHLATITMVRTDASAVYATSLKVDGLEVDNMPFTGGLGQTEVNVGTFFTNAADGGVEAVIDDVLLRQTP